MVTGFSDAVFVLGSTIQTAGFDPAAVNAVHGNVISAAVLVSAVPAMAVIRKRA